MRKQDGLTLIELLTTVAIVAVLAVVAIPSYKTMTSRNRMVASLNDLVADLQYARSEAIKRGRDIIVCPANQQFSNCRVSNDWTSGWIVRDPGDTSASPAIAPAVLRIHEALANGDIMTETDRRSGDTAGRIVFNRNGFSSNARTIQICGSDRDDSKARAIVISTAGHIYTGYDSNGNGIVETGAGNDVSCGS